MIGVIGAACGELLEVVIDVLGRGSADRRGHDADQQDGCQEKGDNSFFHGDSSLSDFSFVVTVSWTHSKSNSRLYSLTYV